jgi:hypothetical protein
LRFCDLFGKAVVIVIEANLNRIHCDVGINFPAARANPVKIPFAHKNTTATQAFPSNPALASASFNYSGHFSSF